MLAFKRSLKQDKLITSLKLFVFYLQMIYYEAVTTKTKQGKAPSVSIWLVITPTTAFSIKTGKLHSVDLDWL